MTSSMNNTKSSTTTTTPTIPNQDGVVMQGYHKKLKTMKKKYFVLCAENNTSSARLEYHDSEKKFKSKSNPKRTIILKNCFNINRRLDTKHKFVIALSTKDESFCIVLDSEQELNKWLRALLALQRGEDIESEPPKPTFEHVWQVQVQRKGLAEDKGIIGSYHVCLTTKSLTLVRIGPPTTNLGEARLYSVEFYLTTIRRCGDSQCYFYMEVGRHSAIGAGELWMETEDTLIAQNMHQMIINAMTSKSREDANFGPMRKRSSSANEASKPISVLQRRQTHTGKPMNSSPLSESPSATSSTVSSTSTIVQTPITKPATSKPLEKTQIHGTTATATVTTNSNSTNSTSQPNDITSRPALSASSCCSSTTTTRATPVITNTSCNPQYPFTAPLRPLGSQRRHSVSAMSSIFHQRTLSLPSGDPLNAMNNSNVAGANNNSNNNCCNHANNNNNNNTTKYLSNITTTINNNNNNNTTNMGNISAAYTNNNNNNNNNFNNNFNNCNKGSTTQNMHQLPIIHQRTRSLPLTEETAIQRNNNNQFILQQHQHQQSSLKHINNIITNNNAAICLCNISDNKIHHSICCAASSSHICYCKGSSSTNNNNNNCFSLFGTLPLNNNFNHFGNIFNNNSKKKNNHFFVGCNLNNENHEMNNNAGSYITGYSSTDIITEHNHSNDDDDDDNDNDNNDNNHRDSIKFNLDKKTIQNFIFKNFNGKNSNKLTSSIQNNIKKSSTTSTTGSPSLVRRGRNCSLTSRSTILGRERCDSLPSRNRTASECSNQSITNAMMPPPRTIPALSNRPHSMYNNRHSHSHSPPMNALSPSTGCSESDGSSLSIDETDSFGHSLTPDESGNFVSRYYNSRSGSVIPEENCDDLWYSDNKKPLSADTNMGKLNNHPVGLSLPISNQNVMRKGSPGTHICSSEMQGQYMDMFSPYSPCGSSPCDQTGSGYMPISPGNELSRGGLYAGSSGGHSRASSLAEENVDGYVPMCPPPPQDYVDMEQSSKHQNLSGLSSAASSCSITSGTPSTDIRFAEYPLDKVKSRFTPDDEDIQSTADRPIRAYSVGSRLEHNKRKLRVDVLSTEQNNSRVRAFSVGSRAKVPRSDLYRGAFIPNLPSCHSNNNNLDIYGTGKGKKSSSAPILVHKSQSSVDRMDDLMEIDFSKNSEQSSTPSPIRFSSFPVSVPSRPTYDHHGSSPKTVSFPGYVEMKPGSPSGGKSSSLTSIKASDSGYLEMKAVGFSNSPSLSSSPIKTISSSKPINYQQQKQMDSGIIAGNESDYMNVSPSSKSTSSMSHGISSSTEDYNNFVNDKPMEVDHFPVITGTPEGYMEMNFSKSNKSEKKTENKLFGGGVNNGAGGEYCTPSSLEKRSASMPIDIKTKDNNYSGLSSSLADTFAQKRYRTDSKENELITSATAGGALSNQGIIFPFSPGSPVKSFVQNNFAQRKCLVDASSGTVTIPEEVHVKDVEMIKVCQETNITPEKYKIINTENSIVNNKKDTTKKVVDALASDYAVMSLSSTKDQKNNTDKNTDFKQQSVVAVESGDYVNYAPTNEKTNTGIISSAMKLENNNNNNNTIISSDYAIMNPISKPKIGTVIPLAVSTTSTTAATTANTKKCFPITLRNPNTITTTTATSTAQMKSPSTFEGFRPISSGNDEMLLNADTVNKKTTSKHGLSSQLNRQLSDRCKKDDNSGYELLQMRSDSSIQMKKISRPNSVNSEKISPLKISGRPNSANSDCIVSISTSSSTSTLCGGGGGGSSSSSSTLCGSKSQSPLANSRPQSFSDCAVASSRPESMGSLVDQNLSSRPPSVSSERELHYASLDLPPSSTTPNTSDSTSPLGTGAGTGTGTGGGGSGSVGSSSITKGNNSSASGDSSTSPSPNAGACQQQPTFTYAQIDFNKSETLKLAMNASNNS